MLADVDREIYEVKKEVLEVKKELKDVKEEIKRYGYCFANANSILDPSLVYSFAKLCYLNFETIILNRVCDVASKPASAHTKELLSLRGGTNLATRS